MENTGDQDWIEKCILQLQSHARNKIHCMLTFLSARGKERCIDAHCYLLRASLLQEIMLCCDLVKYLDTILMALTKVLCSLVH